MNYRRNEDKWSYNGPNYNLIHEVVDVSEESGGVTEPVALTEMKNYLRLEGFGPGSGISAEDPINLTLLEDELTIQDSRLIGMSMIGLVRSGNGYGISTVASNLIASFVSSTGVIGFNTAGNPGGELVVATYGNASANPDTDFDFDDDLITELITAAREKLEVHAGSHFIPKTLDVYFTNGVGMIDLPGPVTGTISLVDSESAAIEDDSITLIGSKFPSIRYPIGEYLKATYEAGYNGNLPKGIKTAIMMQCAYDFEQRGDEQNEVLCKKALIALRPFVKASAFA